MARLYLALHYCTLTVDDSAQLSHRSCDRSSFDHFIPLLAASASALVHPGRCQSTPSLVLHSSHPLFGTLPIHPVASALPTWAAWHVVCGLFVGEVIKRSINSASGRLVNWLWCGCRRRRRSVTVSFVAQSSSRHHERPPEDVGAAPVARTRCVRMADVETGAPIGVIACHLGNHAVAGAE